jgi:hypothetical protein
MDDDTILSICGSSKGVSWPQVKDDTDLYAIRWRPEPQADVASRNRLTR